MSLNAIKKIVLLLVILCFGLLKSNAQGNLPYADDKLFHFGFSLGTGSFDYGVTVNTDSVSSAAVSSLVPSLAVGMIGDMRLARYLNLRFTPTLYFGSRTIQYKTLDGKDFSNEVFSIPINLPLSLKYSAERRDNYRPYLLWGAGVGIELNNDNENPILVRPMNFYTEFGVGCDLYFSYFKLCPELKFAIGLNDVLVPYSERKAKGTLPSDQSKNFYSSALNGLTSKLISLTFNFE